MKKLITSILILATMMLSACSLLDEVNNSLDYVNEAESYINTLSDFAEEAPRMIQDAAVDPDARQDLENQINTLADEINEFNDLEAPAIAEDVHQEIVAKNEVLLEEINTAMENGELVVEKLENSEIINTVNDVTSLLDSIKKLEL